MEPSFTAQQAAPESVDNDAGETYTRLKSWDGAKVFLAEHLTPAKYTPKGWPVYREADIDALLLAQNIRLPEDF